jgi:hypothetical protein
VKTSELFPSKWIKCADLQGRRVVVTIDHLEKEDLGDGEKPVVYFEGKQKGWVLNRTNTEAIGELLGDETDDWHGGRIALVPSKTMYQGKRVDCIRVEPAPHSPAQPKPQRPQPRQEPVPEPEEPGSDADDDLPF